MPGAYIFENKQLLSILIHVSNMTDIISTIPSHFLNISNSTEISTFNSLHDKPQNLDIVMILSTIIASVGIVANFTVIIVFLNDKKLRKKIPNIFIIHQVSTFHLFSNSEH